MKTFLSIPTFRSMKYLHGVLLWLLASAILCPIIVHFLCRPEDRVELSLACFFALAVYAPVMAWVYRACSSNQY